MLTRLFGLSLRRLRPNVPRIQIPSQVTTDADAGKKQSWHRRAVKIGKTYGITFILLRVVVNSWCLISLLKVFLDYLNLEDSVGTTKFFSWILGEESYDWYTCVTGASSAIYSHDLHFFHEFEQIVYQFSVTLTIFPMGLQWVQVG